VTLEEYVRGGGYGRLREVYMKVLVGELELRDPNPPRTLKDMILNPAYTTWYWAVVALVAVTLAVIPLTDAIGVLKYARYVLGTVYVLLLPGYATVEALYPEERSLKPLERLALSIGLSLAIVPLIGLALNYTPLGIRLWPVTIAIALYTLTTATIALYRKYRIHMITLEAREHTTS
jgi:uncharacterized membrane protein